MVRMGPWSRDGGGSVDGNVRYPCQIQTFHRVKCHLCQEAMDGERNLMALFHLCGDGGEVEVQKDGVRNQELACRVESALCLMTLFEPIETAGC